MPHETNRARTGWMQIVGPGVIALFLLLDVSFRFIPPHYVTFRAWESMVLFATGPGLFNANAAYRSTRSYGDLSNMGNLPQLRQYRTEVFTTDSQGFRNRHESAAPFRGVLLMGDSFAAGAGVPDDQSLGEVLARIAGTPVYSLAGDALTAIDIPLNPARMACGVVVWEQSERQDLPLVSDLDPHDPGWKGRFLLDLLGPDGRRKMRVASKYLDNRWTYSPLEILSGRAIRSIEDDRLLPNPYRRNVETATLLNGQKMLFYPEEIQHYLNPNRSQDTAFFVHLRDRLRANGIGLLVVLVPNKYEVYRDLLATPDRRGPQRDRPFMTAYSQRLADAEVPTVDLTGPFRSEAASRLKRDSYLYWLDDTHWNAAGIEKAAAEIAGSPLFARQSTCPENPATLRP